MIELDNNATVLHADLTMREPGTDVHGVVLAFWPASSTMPWVTWRVHRAPGATVYNAESGVYCETLERAEASFDYRRGIRVAQD